MLDLLMGRDFKDQSSSSITRFDVASPVRAVEIHLNTDLLGTFRKAFMSVPFKPRHEDTVCGIHVITEAIK